MSDEEILQELDLGPGSSPPLARPGLYGAYVRDLTEADIAAIEAAPQGVRAPSLVKIRASHHSLARCLASGMRPSQAGLVTGYSASRISILQADATFQALVEEYRSEARSAFANIAERMSDLSLDAIEVLQERLHEAPEGFSLAMLLDVVKAFADRTGHGPGQEVNLKVSSNDLIDRPPRETYEQWEQRRNTELAPPRDEVKSSEGPKGPLN